MYPSGYHRLYEQQRAAPDKGAAMLGDYVVRWRRWAAAGLSELQPLLPPPTPQNDYAYQ